ncbi:MAG: AAA family ATPase, partial [Peptococcus niger]
MLSYIELKNFKSLTDVKIDLRGENKKPKKMIFIYGENGAGKTNLISSILFLEKSLLTLSNNIKLRKIYDKNVPELLSDIENDEIKKEVLDHIIKDSFFDMRSLIQENKTINSEGNMEVKIGFNINRLEGSYELKFDDESVIFEELKYLVNE